MSLIKPLFYRPKYQHIALTVLLLAFSACTSTNNRPSPYQKAKVENIPVVGSSIPETIDPSNQSGDTSTPIAETDRFLRQAIHLEGQAGGLAQPNLTLLSAAEHYIVSGKTDKALEQLQKVIPANNQERARASLIEAHIISQQGDHNLCAQRAIAVADTASSYGDPIQQSFATTVVDARLLASRCLQALGNWEAALSQLIEREKLLSGVAKSENLRYTWSLIGSLPSSTQQMIVEQTPNTSLRNRIIQVQQSNNSNSIPTTVAGSSEPLSKPLNGGYITEANQPIFSFSRMDQPHTQMPSETIQTEWNEQSPRVVALMLPLSSRFASASEIVREAIESAHRDNDSNYRPELVIYDLGSDPLQTPLYFNAAQQNGAQLVIGPLGVDYVDQAVRSNQISLPTILLGGKPDQLSNNAVKFTISPEQEGHNASIFANSLGLSNAAIISDGSNTSARQVQAFKQQWNALGGRIVSDTVFSAQQFDHSTELRNLFAIDQSDARARRFNDTISLKAKFEPYRRQDIDFIYLVTNADAGRLIRPQINFYAASDLPVIGSSNIYNGIADKTNNLDLEGVILPQSRSTFLPSSDLNAEKYSGKKRQLYDLGKDSYALAANLNKLAASSSTSIEGALGLLGLDAKAMVTQKSTWGIFVDGEVLPWDQSQRKQYLDKRQAELEQSAQLEKAPLGSTSQAEKPIDGKRNTYDAETWNQGTNSRR
jgi:outer membrane PBP1 activator LpoA protein